MKTNNPDIEKFRVKTGPFGSNETYGNNGIFIAPGPRAVKLQIMASDGLGWEHVSVTMADSNRKRCPYWDEMCFVKALFWSDDEVVVQYHPKKADYVDNHPFVLHLWRPTESEFQCPDPGLVGEKSLGNLLTQPNEK